MKSALLAAFNAFVSQAKANHLEAAIKTVEKNGLQVATKEEDNKKENK